MSQATFETAEDIGISSEKHASDHGHAQHGPSNQTVVVGIGVILTLFAVSTAMGWTHSWVSHGHDHAADEHGYHGDDHGADTAPPQFRLITR